MTVGSAECLSNLVGLKVGLAAPADCDCHVRICGARRVRLRRLPGPLVRFPDELDPEGVGCFLGQLTLRAYRDRALAGDSEEELDHCSPQDQRVVAASPS